MEFDIILACKYSYILHPEHESIVMNSDDTDIQQLISGWKMFDKLSLAAYIFYRRIEAIKNKIPLICIFTDAKTCTNKHIDWNFSCYDYAIITDKSRRWTNNDSHILYGISVDEAIEVQEELLDELYDLDIYSDDEIGDFRYHNPSSNYTDLGNGEYLLHKYSRWMDSYNNYSTSILPYDMKAAIMYEGWTDRDFQIRYPGYIPIFGDIEHNEGMGLGKCVPDSRDIFIDMLRRRSSIYITIYPGMKMGENSYASRMMKMINGCKLPCDWEFDTYISDMSEEKDPIFADGIYHDPQG